MVMFPRSVRHGAIRLSAILVLAAASACGGGSDVAGIDPAALQVTAVNPDVISSGGTITITGTNFNTTASANTVTVDGMPATVSSATSSQLVVVAPALPCKATHAGTVVVTNAAGSVTVPHQVRGAAGIAVTATGPVLLSAAEAACAELPAGTGRYLMSVVNLDAKPTVLTGFSLIGSLPAANATVLAAEPSVLRQSAAMPSEGAPAGLDAILGGARRATAERLHESILDANRAILSRMQSSRAASPLRTSRSIAPGGRRSATIPVVGETRKFRIAQFTTAVGAVGSCSNFVEVTARAVFIGKRAIVYEDVAAPLANTMDPYFRNVGQEFDNSMYVVDSTYFGDPLVTDPSTDNDGHLSMVFTPSITTGVAGFVTSCDFFPRDSSGTANDDRESNFGEFFYAVVPTEPGTGFSGNTADSWLRGMRSTIVHEVKHIASFGARLTNNAATFEESWLEEGMARHAEEIWARNYVYGVSWKGNSAYRETLYCDVRPSVAECAGKPFAVFNHFSTLYTTLNNPGAYSLFGRVADGDFNFYASSWALVRYSLDRYATSEAAFLRGITQSTTTSGLRSITAQTGGHSSAELVSNWSLAMYLDDNTTSADLNFPTWNTHDIYRGMNRDFSTSNFPKAFPLTPATLASPTFTMNNDGIHGGSFAMYIVPANAAAPSVVRLTGPASTGTASASLRVAMVAIP